MSWESTVLYYREINNHVKQALGGLHSAKCILHSFDFHEIEEYQSHGNWDKAAAALASAARNLESIGADCIVICTNTMHKLADEVQRHLRVPLLHIADLTADELLRNDVRKIALTGTRYTMEQDFYKSRLISRGIEVIVPDRDGIEFVNRVIYEELCLGIVSAESRQGFVAVIERLRDRGAEGVILGCTEIGMLIRPEDVTLPVFDTTLIHARGAAMYSVGI